VSAAGAVTLGSLALKSEPVLLIIASLFALGMLMCSAFDALRGSYTVTIDRHLDLVSVVASAPWRRATERQFALSSFGAVATIWDENYWSYCLELIEKGGRGSLLLKRRMRTQAPHVVLTWRQSRASLMRVFCAIAGATSDSAIA